MGSGGTPTLGPPGNEAGALRGRGLRLGRSPKAHAETVLNRCVHAVCSIWRRADHPTPMPDAGHEPKAVIDGGTLKRE